MGGRSAKAVQLLKDNGIEAKNVKGGILAWIDQVDPEPAEVLRVTFRLGYRLQATGRASNLPEA